ncbi:putative transporter [Tolypocladium ophioglossoides CBS 100239]|uniref:Putative transporter n=1 Tax=Tolypocladium ophioglossoides (strain CBS 100239) TaxID=1163406 RepID=A0A0L0MW86_TOLOC|nr:putative transporter [Tolypocladium ophioglossoides CBS 100239]
METSSVRSSEKIGVQQVQDACSTQQQGSMTDVRFTDAKAQGTITSSAANDKLIERNVLWKMDIRLIPMLALLYLLSFLDRGNIGNAKIEGLQEDLKLTPDQYNWCLTVFFFTYAAFEVPSNLLLKRLRPSRWLPIIMVFWGIVVTLMGVVQSYRGLLVARLFLGVAEAGLFPGVTYYLTMWYCREEIQLRQALFFSAASIAGAFGGLLAFAISKMDGVGGIAGWRWIFILEGIATVLIAVMAFFVIYDFPETAGFLTEEEREFVIRRLKYQGQIAPGADPTSESGGTTHHDVQVGQAEEFQWKYVRQAFTDWQVWVNVFLYWGIVCPLYGISLFLPTILKSLGYTSNAAQLMTIPIYITAAVLAIVLAYVSDRVGKRSPFVIGLMCVMVVGFTMCISSSNPRVVYGGIFITACAIYPAVPGIISWMSNNVSGSYKRSAGMAIQIGLGNLAGAMASNFYREADSPRYFLGHGLELGFIAMGLVAAFILLFGYRTINKQRQQRIADGAHNRMTPQELSEMGDKAVTFRYMY